MFDKDGIQFNVSAGQLQFVFPMALEHSHPEVLPELMAEIDAFKYKPKKDEGYFQNISYCNHIFTKESEGRRIEGNILIAKGKAEEASLALLKVLANHGIISPESISGHLEDLGIEHSVEFKKDRGIDKIMAPIKGKMRFYIEGANREDVRALEEQYKAILSTCPAVRISNDGFGFEGRMEYIPAVIGFKQAALAALTALKNGRKGSPGFKFGGAYRQTEQEACSPIPSALTQREYQEAVKQLYLEETARGRNNER